MVSSGGSRIDMAQIFLQSFVCFNELVCSLCYAHVDRALCDGKATLIDYYFKRFREPIFRTSCTDLMNAVRNSSLEYAATDG